MAGNSKEEENVEQLGAENWRILATTSFRHKIFVKSSGTEDEKVDKEKREKSLIELGESTSKFYQDVLQLPSSGSSEKPMKEKRKAVKKEAKIEKTKFHKETFFRLATDNRADELEKLIQNSTDVDLDATDNFGWTALMMAACENSVDSFRLLLELGANLEIRDRSGTSAATLAQKKNHRDILDAINEHQNAKDSTDDDSDEELESGTDFCPDCKIEIPRSSSKQHKSSTVHLFSCKYNTNATIKSFGIARSNRGYKLMKTIGWDGNSALGPKKDGKLYPIKTVLRHKRTGLGMKQDDAKITHFKANDTRAVHYRPPPRALSRKEILEQSLRDKRKEQQLRRALS